MHLIKSNESVLHVDRICFINFELACSKLNEILGKLIIDFSVIMDTAYLCENLIVVIMIPYRNEVKNYISYLLMDVVLINVFNKINEN